MRALLIDLETYSDVDIKTQGVARYAEDPSTRVLCASFHEIEEGTAEPLNELLWWPGMQLPGWVVWHLLTGSCVAHNAAFERLVLQHHSPPGWPQVPLERWHCTQAMCAYRALPLSLDDVGEVLKLGYQKDPKGVYLIRRCCTPKAREKPGDLEALGEYCLQDGRTEAALAYAIGWELPPAERALWLLDQQMNDRGIPLDLDLLKAIDRLSGWLTDYANKRLRELTGGAVKSASNHKALADWAGVDSVSKGALAVLDMSDLSPEVQEALTIRPSTSLRKAAKALGCVSADGRIRHTQQYHAATTGRWGGRLVQPHNMPRPTCTPDFDALINLPPEMLASVYGPATLQEMAVSALRGTFAASEGETITRADLSAIEARVVLWLAGETDAVEKYRQGVDMYCDFASTLHGRKIVKGDPERMHGKIGILGCGFQAGARRLLAQAQQDRVPGVTFELMETLVQLYREDKAPRVPIMWRNMNDAALQAVTDGGEVTVPGLAAPVTFFTAHGREDHAWLMCRLPSGRLLHFFDPHLAQNKFGRLTVQWRAMKPTATGGRSWRVVSGYGGLYTENVVQAIARDVIAGGLTRLVERGHQPLFLVHDETVAEGTLEASEMEAILSEPVPWAPGLPIAAEGTRERRFSK